MSNFGYRARLSRIPGETPKGLLARPLYLPALLGSVGRSEEATHTEFETFGAGEFSQPSQGGQSARRLQTLDDLETLTVEWNPDWFVEDDVSMNMVRETLFFILRSKRPVELLIAPRVNARNDTVIHKFVTFRRVSSIVKQGEPDSVYFTIGSKEWRSLDQRRRAAGGSREVPTTHKLTASDSLISLARFYYGKPLFWSRLAQKNGIKKWGQSEPLVKMHRFKVGDKIKLLDSVEVDLIGPTQDFYRPGAPPPAAVAGLLGGFGGLDGVFG